MNSTPRRIVQRRSVFRPLIQFPIVWIIAALIAATILACSGSPDEAKPSVTIGSPLTGSTFQAGQEIEVNVSASDYRGITQVELWANGSKVTQGTTPEGKAQVNVVAVLAWTPATPGTYEIEAHSINADNQILISGAIQITVQQGPGPQPVEPTFTPAVTIIPIQPTYTATPGSACTPLVLVRARALNVRNGPGTTYSVIGKLEMDQSAEVVGRNDGSTWWQIRFGTGYGWVSGSYVTPSCTGNVPIVTQPTPAPTATPVAGIKFWADATTVNAGQCTTIRWEVDNVRAVYLNEGGADQGVSGHGNKSVCPGNTTTYRLIVILNNNQRVEQPLTIYVQGSAININFRADSTTIKNGDCTVLRWDVDNAKAVYISDGQQEGGVSAHASAQICPSQTTNYRLRAVGWDNQQQTRDVKIKVQSGPGQISFWADRTDINKGECTNIHWTVTNAKNVYLNLGQGEQKVDANGSTQVCPGQTTTYQLRVEWQDGQQSSDNLTITVHNQQPAPVVQFSANPQTIHTGDSSTLSWNVQNSQQVYLDGNSVGAQGSKQVSPNQETIYSLRVIGLDGSDTSYQVTVSVIIAINTPTIDIQANPTDIDQGQCSTLSWNASHGSEFYINGDSVGQSGSKQVCPNQTTDYTFRAVTLGTMDAYRTARVNVRAVAEPTPEPMPMPTVAPPEPQPEPPQPEPTPTEMIIGPGGLPPEEPLIGPGGMPPEETSE